MLLCLSLPDLAPELLEAPLLGVTVASVDATCTTPFSFFIGSGASAVVSGAGDGADGEVSEGAIPK